MSDREEAVKRFYAERPTELEYLKSIEELANAVVDAAYDEYGVDELLSDGPAKTPLQRSITRLARSLRIHLDADDRLDESE